MDRILLALLFCLGLGASALADGRVFPPDNCSTASPFMAFNATPDSNTYCINGQSVLSNALPGCGPDQIVSFNGTDFYCKDAPAETEEAEAPTIPDCASGEVLTGSGGALTCVAQAGGGDSGSLCGLAKRSGFGDASDAECAANYGYQSVATCKGSSIVTSCPSGYTAKAYVIVAAGSSSCVKSCSKN